MHTHPCAHTRTHTQWQSVDMIPASLNDELTDFSAKVQHYESKVDDLNRTVDELQV